MIRSHYRQNLSAWLLLLALIAPALAIAQQSPFRECGGGPSPEYKLLVDEFGFTRPELASDPELAGLPGRLAFEVGNSEKSLELENKRVFYLTVACPGRSPHDSTVFSQAVTESLNSRNVLLEIWGVVDGDVANGHVSRRVARLGYTIVPVRFYEFASATPIRGVYEAEYTISGQQPGKMANLLGASRELSAYWKIAVGIKALKASAYDEARGYLCQASIELKRLPNLDQALSNYVTQSAQKAVTTARGDAAYKGSLKLAGADQACL